jgi:hypothetical protein
MRGTGAERTRCLPSDANGSTVYRANLALSALPPMSV